MISLDMDRARALQATLSRWLLRTPVAPLAALEERVGGPVHGKLEFLQRTSTFKPRGALAVLLSLDETQRRAGVTAVSAGNHAIAVAFAAREIGTSAKVVMMKSANPLRVQRCRDFGAEVVLADDVHAAFEQADAIKRDEGRYLVHPYEGELTSLGTATLGIELCEQLSEFDAVIVPIGGGGLCSGVAAAVRHLRPAARIFGVEPTGADSMYRSFEAGSPQRLVRVDTIADSLGAPFALPYSFALCRSNVDEIVRISDEEMCTAMRLLFREQKMAVEAACAASTAALLGPLRARLQGLRVALVLCGSNIDWTTWAAQAQWRRDSAD